jgi:hypothetical protein
VWKAQHLALLKLPEKQSGFEASLLSKRGCFHLAVKPRHGFAGVRDRSHIMSNLTWRQLVFRQKNAWPDAG